MSNSGWAQTRRAVGWAGVLVSAAVAVGCAQTHRRSELYPSGAQDMPAAAVPDASPMAPGADGGDPAWSAPGASRTSPPGMQDHCTQCTYPTEGARFEAVSCCSEHQRCGLSFPSYGFAQCFEQHATGERDLNCPDYRATSDILGLGCCRSDGTCGVLDPVLDLGCVQLPFLAIKPCG